MKKAILLSALFMFTLVGVVATSQESSAGYYNYPYYTKWYYNTDYNYHYSHYYYGGGVDYYHRAYYFPTRYYPSYGGSRYVYYYNWRSNRFWGRMDLENGKYSMLTEDKKKEKLTDIKETDFPEPVALDKITIPGSEHKMTLPPMLPKDTEN